MYSKSFKWRLKNKEQLFFQSSLMFCCSIDPKDRMAETKEEATVEGKYRKVNTRVKQKATFEFHVRTPLCQQLTFFVEN